MGDDSGKVQVTYNGEIYNFKEIRTELERLGFRFRGTSDTEVLLQAYMAWGFDCLERLNGMFAFAIFDDRREFSREGRLFLARDRAGEKPLYFQHHDWGIRCASELKALMVNPRFPRRLDLRSLNFYLGLGYVPDGRCILENVEKLPPSTSAIYDLEQGTLKTWRYWSLPAPNKEHVADADALTERLESLLYESVRKRLVADVPVGVLLSGGIDSSLVTAVAARSVSGPLKTFTISFPGYASFDESGHARRVARYFGTEHHELPFEGDFISLLPGLAAGFDEPLADSSLIPTHVVSCLSRRHVTVALGGDGGDELFGGYPTYRRSSGWRAAIESLPPSVRRSLADTARQYMPLGMRGRQYLQSLGGDPLGNFVSRSVLFDLFSRRKLFTPSAWKSLARYEDEPERYRTSLLSPEEMVPIERLTRLDFQTYLPDDILMKVDRASMAVSLEVRSPWLDREIVEFAYGKVPPNLKVDGNIGRIIQRRLAKRLLPDDFDTDRKQGFSIPLFSLGGPEWINYCASIFNGSGDIIFNRSMVKSFIDEVQSRAAATGYLFALVMFEIWRKHYHITIK
jgi:asparagine synthase (glutamine-hydrolysing)